MNIKRYDNIDILLKDGYNGSATSIRKISYDKAAYRIKGNFLIILVDFSFEADIRDSNYTSHVYDLALVKSYKVTNNKR